MVAAVPVGAEAMLALATVVARWTQAIRGRGAAARSEASLPGVRGVRKLRVVDAGVWAGGQPDPAAYPDLAAHGVRTVVDLRTGVRDDPRRDDPSALHLLGLAYAPIPVPDGHVPPDDAVERFLQVVVESAGGTVFLHCGAGVGRSSSMTAAYERGRGRRPRAAEHLAIGPHSLAQAWFVVTGRRGALVRRASEVFDAPRRIRSRARVALALAR